MRKLNVYLKYIPTEPIMVGTLVETNDKKFFFEYDSKYLESGYNISPFKLSFTGGLQGNKDNYPERVLVSLMTRFLMAGACC